MACTLTGPHTLNLQSFDCIPPLPATSSTHTNRQSMSWFVSQFLQAFSDCLLHNKPHINMQQLHDGRRERKRKKRKQKESIKLPTKIAHYDWNRRWFSSSKNIINGAPQTQTFWLHRKTHPSTFQVMRDETMTHPWVLHLLKMSLYNWKHFGLLSPIIFQDKWDKAAKRLVIPLTSDLNISLSLSTLCYFDRAEASIRRHTLNGLSEGGSKSESFPIGLAISYHYLTHSECLQHKT